MADSIRLIRDASVALERALKEKGAVGKGMGDMSGDLEQRHIITPEQGAEIRKLAGFRNRVMHDDYEPSADETQGFTTRINAILRQFTPQRRQPAKRWLPFLKIFMQFSFQAVIGFGVLHILYSWNARFIVELIMPFFLLYLAIGYLTFFFQFIKALLKRPLH